MLHPVRHATGGPAVEEFTDRPRKITLVRDVPDRVFRAVAAGGGVTVLLIMLLVGTFLAIKAAPALHEAGFSFFTTQAWNPDEKHFGVAAILIDTILIALVAVCIAVPLSTATALYITEYAPRRMKAVFIGVIDLMAAIPSIVYGLWGFYFLQTRMEPISAWIAQHFGWIPIFHVKGIGPHTEISSLTLFASSTLIAGMVVGMMITPVITSIMREVFAQAPLGEREGAIALGAT